MAKEIKKEKEKVLANNEDKWAHRTEMMECSTCMWFAEKLRKMVDEEILNMIGRCRRHALTMNGYPVVYGKDWCGDHKLDENAL